MSTTAILLSTTGSPIPVEDTKNNRLATKDYRLAEYNALRGEILKHMDIEYQVSTLCVTAFGVLTTLGLVNVLNTNSEGALPIFLYPVLALLFSCRWRYSEHRIREIGIYIREHIEQEVDKDDKGVKGWENYLHEHNSREHIEQEVDKDDKGVKRWENYLHEHNSLKKPSFPGLYWLSAWGTFIFTEVLAIVIGVILVLQKKPSFLPFGGLSLLFTGITIFILLKELKGYRTLPQTR